jgi:hypothetical protein
MCFNLDLGSKSRQFEAGGKASQQSITVVMRKFIVLANALLKNNRTW